MNSLNQVTSKTFLSTKNQVFSWVGKKVNSTDDEPLNNNTTDSICWNRKTEEVECFISNSAALQAADITRNLKTPLNIEYFGGIVNENVCNFKSFKSKFV